MSTRKFKGNAIPQYIIILAAVAVVIIPGFLLIGKTIYNQFAGYASMQESNNALLESRNSDWGKALVKGDLTAGQLGGQPGDPVRKCIDGVCAIDYGTIVLNNIPDNFGEMVETSGTAGGSDIILNVMGDIAQQMEQHPEEFTPDQVAKIKALMAQGKDIVTMEKYIEDKITSHQADLQSYYAEQQALIAEIKNSPCSSGDPYYYNTNYNTDYNTCQPLREKTYALSEKYRTVMDDIFGYGDNVPTITTAGGQPLKLNYSNINSMLNPNSSVIIKNGSINTWTSLKDQVNVTNDPRYEIYQKQNFDDYINGNIKLEANQPADYSDQFSLTTIGEYLKQVKAIMDDPDANPAVQQVTKELSREVFDLTKSFNNKINSISGGMDALYMMEMDYYYYNYYNGYADYAEQSIEKARSALWNTQAPTTKLDLAVICGSTRGQFNADNVSCQQQSSSNTDSSESTTTSSTSPST